MVVIFVTQSYSFLLKYGVYFLISNIAVKLLQEPLGTK